MLCNEIAASETSPGKANAMKQSISSVFLVCLLCAGLAQAYEIPAVKYTRSNSSRRSLDLGVEERGISFGNSPRWSGLRLNLVDRHVERVTGINLTFWKPGRNPDAVINGIALGGARQRSQQ